VEIGHSITSPAHVTPPVRPRPLPIGVPPLEVALAVLDNIQWQQNHQDDLQNELEKAFIITPISMLHGSSQIEVPTAMVEESQIKGSCEINWRITNSNADSQSRFFIMG
jgi:hypothetical protein